MFRSDIAHITFKMVSRCSWGNTNPALAPMQPSGIQTYMYDPLIMSWEHEPLHHSAPTVVFNFRGQAIIIIMFFKDHCAQEAYSFLRHTAIQAHVLIHTNTHTHKQKIISFNTVINYEPEKDVTRCCDVFPAKLQIYPIWAWLHTPRCLATGCKGIIVPRHGVEHVVDSIRTVGHDHLCASL